MLLNPVDLMLIAVIGIVWPRAGFIMMLIVAIILATTK